MASALVTGGAGFIGSHVAAALVAAGCRVVVLDDLSGGRADQVPAGAEFVRGCVTDAGLVNDLFDRHRFDRVFHFAAFAAEGLSHFVRRFTYTTNVLGTATIVNAAVRHGCLGFVFASSVAVYGSNPHTTDEACPPRPDDPYGVSKYAAELDLAAAAAMFGLPYTVLRLHNVYGPGQSTTDRYRNVVGIFLRQALRGEPLTVFGDGGQMRAFTYIGDLVPLLVRAADLPAARGRAINLGAAEQVRVSDLARLVFDALCVEGSVRYEPPRREARSVPITHVRADEVFGPRPVTPLRDGLAVTAARARLNGPQPLRPKLPLELEAGLPPVWGE